MNESQIQSDSRTVRYPTVQALEAWRGESEQREEETSRVKRTKVNRLYWCELGAYKKDEYITGSAALNLPDPASGANGGFADWHGLASWKMPEEGIFVEHVGGTKYRTPWAAIGEEGIREGNEAISGIGHPGGSREEIIWVASHTRAILDIAYTRWSRKELHRSVPIAGTMVSDWLWSEEQMRELKDWIQKTGQVLPTGRRVSWNAWGETLKFAAGYEYYKSRAPK